MDWPPNTGLLSSFRHAIDGLRHVVLTERNARIHLVAALMVVLCGAWLRLGTLEWALVIVAIALVFAAEMLNTVVERVVDLITSEHHPIAGHAKDVAAGATLVTVIAALLLGLVVLGPRAWQKATAIWNSP